MSIARVIIVMNMNTTMYRHNRVGAVSTSAFTTSCSNHFVHNTGPFGRLGASNKGLDFFTVNIFNFVTPVS